MQRLLCFPVCALRPPGDGCFSASVLYNAAHLEETTLGREDTAAALVLIQVYFFWEWQLQMVVADAAPLSPFTHLPPILPAYAGPATRDQAKPRVSMPHSARAEHDMT